MDRTEGTKIRFEFLVIALMLALLTLGMVSAAHAAGPDLPKQSVQLHPAERALSELDSQPVMNYSGDDAYDLAADGQPAETRTRYANRFSGDDAYDPATGGLFYEPIVRYVSNFSGDDAYDPTFGWTPHQVQVVQAPVR